MPSCMLAQMALVLPCEQGYGFSDTGRWDRCVASVSRPSHCHKKNLGRMFFEQKTRQSPQDRVGTAVVSRPSRWHKGIVS